MIACVCRSIGNMLVPIVLIKQRRLNLKLNSKIECLKMYSIDVCMYCMYLKCKHSNINIH